MAQYDLPLDELRGYQPDLAVPADLADFWAATLSEARTHPLDASFTPVDNQLAVIDSWDVRFAGFGGTPVRGWLHLPAQRTGPLPAVVQYIGYGGGRGLVHEDTLWAAAGYAHLIMDTRGQGSGGLAGDTPDEYLGGGGPAYPGYLTRGITDPANYHYRRVFTDAVRAVEAVRAHEAVDPDRVAVNGSSQGGGISLAVAGLVPGLTAVMPEVPFLCDFPRAITLAETLPYAEIARYLATHRDHEERVLRTLGYFDAAVLARLATAPALFSVGLMDTLCPPSTVFAAYNHYAGAKDIRVYPYNDHEGGEGFHTAEQLRWLAGQLG